jgi:tetratricopeptide (TPR) repeat protein
MIAALMRATIIVLALLVHATAAGDPATAKKHNNAGMKAYSKQEYEEAQKLFEKAIAEDPAFVKAHYNRASVAALQGDVDVMKEEFDWLRASKDAEAARVLAKSKTDKDFRSISLQDDARAVLGLKPLADTPLDQLLLEYKGAWSGIDEGMSQGYLEATFMPRGKVKGRDHSGDSGEWYPWTGTYKVDGKKLVITIRKTKTTFELQPCDLGPLCLVREEGGFYYAR